MTGRYYAVIYTELCVVLHAGEEWEEYPNVEVVLDLEETSAPG